MRQDRVARRRLMEQIDRKWRRVRQLRRKIDQLESALNGQPDSSELREMRNGLLSFLFGAHPSPPPKSRGSSKGVALGTRTSPKQASRKAAVGRWYVAFTDVCGKDRHLTGVEATSKTGALAEAKRRLREDGENLKGAKFHVERED